MPALATEDIYNMSLTQLMDMTFKTQIASGREQMILDSPGIITVITAKELNSYGARNLHDAMRLIPAFQQIYPQLTHRNAVAIRGQVARALDKYFLILLNGKPLRDPILYGINAPLYEGIPLELIDRLEIIRGPGSVIYGSNAFTGVMDIITKKPKDKPVNVVAMRTGSFGTKINEVFLNTEISEQLSIVAALRKHDSDGWKLEFIDPSGSQNYFYNKNHSWGGFLELNYKDFSVNYFKAKVEERATLSSGLIADVTMRPSDREFYSFDYHYDINQGWDGKIRLSRNTSTIAASTDYDGDDTVLEITSHGIYKGSNLDFGIKLRRSVLIDAKKTKVSNVYHKSIFAQLDTELTDIYKLIVGLQVVDPQKSAIQYAPRISLIGALSDNYNIKLIYGRAYSSPTGIEFSLDLPGLFSGNPDLVPTTNDNYDFQISHQQKNYFTAVNLFYSEVKNSINLVEITPGQALPKQFQNLQSEKVKGFEIEGKFNYSPVIQLSASYSYQTSTDSNGQKNAKLLSNYMLKTGVIYDNLENFSLSLFNVYHSKPGNRQPIRNEFNPEEKPYSHLTLNMNYIIKNISADNDLTLNFYIDNMINNDAIFMADATLSNLNTMPKVAERSYYLGAKLDF